MTDIENFKYDDTPDCLKLALECFEREPILCRDFNIVVQIIARALAADVILSDNAKSHYRLVAAWHKNTGCDLATNHPNFIIK